MSRCSCTTRIKGIVVGFEPYGGFLLEGDEIVHFRPSGNAPELRCYAEAATQERAGALVQGCLRRLQRAC